MYLLLALLGFVSGFINAIAGGGGLLVLPVLLWLGVPPVNALATGKFQAVFGTLSSSYNYFRQGFMALATLFPIMFLAAISSVAGTHVVLGLAGNVLDKLLPFCLIAIAIYMMFTPGLNDDDYPPRLGRKKFVLIMGVTTGFYGGFFGPGIGALTALGFSALQGYNLRKAAAHAKPVVLTINIVSVLIFLLGGHVLIGVGICMAVTQIIGAYVGSSLAIQKGAVIIKPLLVCVTIAIAIKLLAGL